MASKPAAPRTHAPDSDGKFSISEDWLAFAIGLILLTLCLTGVIPEGLIP
ncbi:hypothetical protein [Propionimicrobium sp. PCR01-08-3]|nr:hypothetical protein [Propionimicrobium sp. PCR01-08-3]WIY82791.1 hypothetical protein QQ658_00030 [Propionimicrobium sp. PCR01-08-3]